MRRIAFKQTIVLFAAGSVLCGFLFSGCSSAPKRTMERTAIAEKGYARLELANTELTKGEVVSAKNDADAAYEIGISIDNADLITKVCLTKVTLATRGDGTLTDNAQGNVQKALLQSSAYTILNEAKDFATRSSDVPFNTALCSLYESRLMLDEGSSGSLDKAIACCDAIESTISKKKEYLAYLYRTRGEILFAQKKYDLAQKAFFDAADLHTKERYLSEIGLDYYYAARALSAQKKKAEALDSLNKALSYDRLDENTAGIGADYYGLATVLLQQNPTTQEKEFAAKYAQYSAQIYAAGGYTDLAQKSMALLQKLQ